MAGNPNINMEELKELIVAFACKAGEKMARMILTLYFVLRSDSTPLADKILVYAALAYLVLPVEVISKKVPLIGWIDEAVSLAIVYSRVKKNITDDVLRQVESTMLQLNSRYSSPEGR